MAPEDASTQPPPDTELKSIGRYELIDKIGKGGMGVVYRGKDTVIGRLVAIKMLICEGLSFAHARGIVHREVKPANLFVTSDGQLKILDFGVARIASSKLTRSGLIVGTPDYMSPEQVMGTTVDQRSDVFSAGSVCYQLLSGRKPFAAKRLPEVLNKVMAEPPAPLTDAEAPHELAAVVMKALEKDPTKRHPRMIEMLASLTRFLQGWDRQTREMAMKACESYHENERLIAARGPAGDGTVVEVA